MTANAVIVPLVVSSVNVAATVSLPLIVSRIIRFQGISSVGSNAR
ncbi:MAG: hypothetical protein ACRD4V_08810 [Candidatus Acidiferrales bacterium]